MERERKRVSTLDLVGHGGIVGVGGEPWAQAAAKVSVEFGMGDLPVLEIGMRCEIDDVTGDWAALREIEFALEEIDEALAAVLSEDRNGGFTTL